MNSSISRRFGTSFLTIALAYAALTQSAFADDLKPPSVPPEIQVPEGNTPYLEGHAVGTQDYNCLPSATGYSWTFFAPQATLFADIKWYRGNIQQQIVTHFLSPNPMENGTPRATWQSSFDTSAIWGRALATSRDTNFVAADAIPWLLLQAVGAQRGPTEGSTLSDTSFIHRVNTSGGVAPGTGCSLASNVGSTALVPYRADYFFYKSSAGK